MKTEKKWIVMTLFFALVFGFAGLRSAYADAVNGLEPDSPSERPADGVTHHHFISENEVGCEHRGPSEGCRLNPKLDSAGLPCGLSELEAEAVVGLPAL